VPCRPATRRPSRVADYLDYYADDPETSVGLAYIEGITDGYGLMSRLARAAAASRSSC
jgi:acyl-CoA synthetase (NDP forming)